MPTTRQQARRAATPGPASSSQPISSTSVSTSISTSSSTSVHTPSRAKKRVAVPPPSKPDSDDKVLAPKKMSAHDEERPFINGDDDVGAANTVVPPLPASRSASWVKRNQWIVFALASGACAAFNGVFAKLTTTDLTTSLSMAVARLFGLEKAEKVVEVIVRGSFFGLNLVFNGVMWTLFTQALARGNSTTQVSIMNTSCNFVITAILGFAIFSEALPPLWWLGAAMLVAGNVIIGSKDESAKEPVESDAASADAFSLATQDDHDGLRARFRDAESDEDKDNDEDRPHLNLDEERVRS
ncbi:hypothetical protein QBC35DRAFT_249268 [Podospora australis]|uniref:Transmembrane protein 42 n=1 Tax=Podospora australis TaxID=1536484 RepID=A0AAN7AID6_9PEZI|nr:hypothetical protein QBC35DRAFT_249268 [Podospora australis]